MELLQRNFRNQRHKLPTFDLHLRKLFPMSVQSTYQKAFFFAAQKHHISGNWVNGTGDVPYAVHIGNVAMEIIFAHHQSPTFDLDFAVQLALLHDVLEDTSCEETEMEERFGTAVVEGVKALTKNESLEKSLQMADSLERILVSPPEVGMVKLADRITNLQPPPSHWTSEKIKSYHSEAELILNTLGHLNAALSERMKEQMAVYQSFF